MTFEFLHPFRNARERQLAALAAEREHQLAVIQSVVQVIERTLSTSQAVSAENAAAMLAMANASAEQAKGFTEWINSFKITESPTSSFVREEDEYRTEQQKLALLGFPTDQGLELPEEFRLALELQKAVAADDMR